VKRISSLIAFVVTTIAVSTTAIAIAPAAQAATTSIAKSTYYDKTLAGIVGEVGGFLSGYEFSANNPDPFPDSWFDPANGPYAGNFAHFTPPGNTADYIRLLSPGRVRGQDNYFMDFFNQRILAEKGISATDADIRDEYLHYGISDYGGSGIAYKLMNAAGMKPFQTGRNEFNNVAWCCEPYIETDTLGFIAPGMPQTARALAQRFASISGTFDTTTWSMFMAGLMSEAYVQTDARVALQQAALALPHDSWPYQIYQLVTTLHAQNTDWRTAQAQLIAQRRWLYGADDDRVIADINQGTFMLAILYGNNDYLQTMRIASIGGNEGVDNATPIGGLMGVVKGMAGTPQAFLDKVYAGGNGVFVNDTTGVLQTYVLSNYPAEQKWTDLATLYQRNMEAVLQANGGQSTTTAYVVARQAEQPPVTVAVPNGDFESGTLAGWTATPAANAKAEKQTGVATGNAHYTLSHSGNYKGTVFTDASTPDVSLSRSVTGLVPGATYRAQAYLESVTNGDASFYVDNGGAVRSAAAYSTEDMGSAGTLLKGRTYAQRAVEFTATGTSATVGLRLRSATGAWANMDDVTLTQITKPTTVRYEAENAVLAGGATAQSATTASGTHYAGGVNGSSAQFTVNATTAGEYRFALDYASTAAPEGYQIEGAAAWPLPASMDLSVNGVDQGRVFLLRTGHHAQFSADVIPIPVGLRAGSNTVTLRWRAGAVDLDYADVSSFPAAVLDSSTNPIANPGFETGAPTQTAAGWDTWPGTAAVDADADYVESGGHTGSYRLTHYKASAYEVYTSQTVRGLTDGTYTVRAWATGGGGQTSAYLDVKNYGGADVRRDLPQNGWPTWTQVSITGVQVTGGQATVGFYSKAGAGKWLSVDDVEFVRQ
jgi:hypothetical protein